jgi:hypothetical protein
MADKKIPQDIDGASAGRKFKKSDPGLPEQPGSGIKVDKDYDDKVKKYKDVYDKRDTSTPLNQALYNVADAVTEPIQKFGRGWGLSENKAQLEAKGEGMKSGGSVSSASKRADGIAQRGKTRGTMVMCGGGMAKK